jgi:Baseplate J-like protein
VIYFCCDKNRRDAVANHPTLNGIDFVEILDLEAIDDSHRQRFIYVNLLKDLTTNFSADNVQIEGGERIRNIRVLGVNKVDKDGNPDSKIIEVEVNQPGDFSSYTLRLIRGEQDFEPPEDFDPLLSEVEFSFKVECPNDFDCEPERECPPERKPEPQINYLAKDYSSFRRLILDRMALLMPQWRESNPADLGMALVELLAYVGDHLSYQQDAVATEAYLGTARRRISVRRHARLVDYFISDGSNARTWVHIRVTTDIKKGLNNKPVLEQGTSLATLIPGQGTVLADDDRILDKAEFVFETMQPMDELYKKHNEMNFYTWDDGRCCLPKGATRATLSGHYPDLKVGDVLIFEEVIGPNTGNVADADPEQRHPVRLTHVRAWNEDDLPLTDVLHDDDNEGPKEITEIAWWEEDALPFAFCVSTRTKENISVARGNIVSADHGRGVSEGHNVGQSSDDVKRNEKKWTVPEPVLNWSRENKGNPCEETKPKFIPARFRPFLDNKPLTQAASYDHPTQEPPYDHLTSARIFLQPDLRKVAPAIVLESGPQEHIFWKPKRDLINSDDLASEFVVETESDGTSFLRFGDDDRGLRPNSGTQFVAKYRVGNGTSGNIGADTLKHIQTGINGIEEIRNPLPAQKGTDPESIQDVRNRAPQAFRTQERAVTPKDYEDKTNGFGDVQRTAATFRWTGSWHTVFLTIDRENGLPVDEGFEKNVRTYVERFRMAGYDLEVNAPMHVPLEIEMMVCVKPDYFRSHVKAALMKVFSNRSLPDGRLGVFHPDNFTFGQPVYLSSIYAAAQEVPGVASVNIINFQRQRQPEPDKISRLNGVITFDRLEIARLDNDPNFMENGVFKIQMEGGK